MMSLTQPLHFPPLFTLLRIFFSQQPLKFTATLYAKPVSSSAFSDDEHGVSNLTMVDSECDFDADVRKTVELHSVVDDDDEEEDCSNVGDSTTVELENGDCMVASDDDDDVGLERCEGYLHIASRNPVEVYRELRNAEKGAKQTRCDWEMMQQVFNYFGKSGSRHLHWYVILSYCSA